MKGPKLEPTVMQIAATAEEYQLWKPGHRIVVAVSGGADSVALLHILHQISLYRTPLTLFCAHVHHGYRAESDAEAELVQKYAESMHIPFEMVHLNMPKYLEETGRNSQDAARERRYAFLHQVAEKYKADSIALAHHADDQAETVMLHMLRGSGASGLSGMKIKRTEKNVELIRPCLRITKTDLEKLCEKEELPYLIDSSNMNRKYLRNAIRLDVLPFLGQYNGQIKESLYRMAEVISTEDDYMEAAAEQTFADMVMKSGDQLTFSVPAFKGLHVALQRRLIKLILNYLPSNDDFATFSRIESIRKGVVQTEPTTWILDIGQGIVCMREYNSIIFTARKSVSEHYSYQLHSPDGESFLYLNEIERTIHLAHSKGMRRPLSANEAQFDLSKLHWPLTVRARLPGDTMKVMGLNGSKKVKDIFIDAKIPPSLRSRIPLVCDVEGNILWIPGVRRSIHAPVTDQSAQVIQMWIE